MIDLNATQAAIRAGYSAKTANEQAAQLLAKLSIQAEIERLKAVISTRNDITHDRIVQEQARLAFSNHRWLHDDRGEPIPINLLSVDAAACIASVEIDDNGRYKYKLWDKTKALIDLAQRVPVPAQSTQKSPDDDNNFTASIMALVDASNKLRE